MIESHNSSFKYQENYPVSAFVDYLGTKLCWSSSGRKHHHFRWLFWSPDHNESQDLQTLLFSYYPTAIPATPSNDHVANIKEKIKYAIQHIIESYIDYCLVQYWAPEMCGGRRFLTTVGQPFAVDWLCKGLCWYRKHCLSHVYLVDLEANEAELGPPGRVFRTGLPESSPDLRLYSTEEYPLRNQSMSCGIRAYMALPVYEMVEEQCVGVLEFVVFSAGYINIINEVAEGLKAADLRWTRASIDPPNSLANDLQNETDERGKQQVLKEIEEMFEEMKTTPQLYLAQAWITIKLQYTHEVNDTAKFGTIFLEQAKHKVFVEDEEQYNSSTTHFVKATKLHGLILGNGIVGTLLATYKSFFCPSICNFSITEFPLVHYARLARLTASFSVCLQSILTGDDVYVLEFFLLPGEYSLSFLPLVMTTIQQFGSFKLLSGQLVGEELSVKAIEFGKNNEYDLDQSIPYPLRIETLHYGDELEKLRTRFRQLHFGSDVMDFNTVATSVEQSSINMSENNSNKSITRASKRERAKQKFHICYEDLQPYFGKTLRDAEKGLGVSRSTLKRACRDHNITRWPSNEKNRVNPLLFQKKGCRGCEDKNSTLERTSSDLEFMIVEASFEEDIIKFKLPFPSRMENLVEEVGRRLKLNVTSFRMKYMDEDGKWILLTCDDDLLFCMETLASSGNNIVKMLVQL